VHGVLHLPPEQTDTPVVPEGHEDVVHTALLIMPSVVQAIP
jgi:hypothetical protein